MWRWIRLSTPGVATLLEGSYQRAGELSLFTLEVRASNGRPRSVRKLGFKMWGEGKLLQNPRRCHTYDLDALKPIGTLLRKEDCKCYYL